MLVFRRGLPDFAAQFTGKFVAESAAGHAVFHRAEADAALLAGNAFNAGSQAAGAPETAWQHVRQFVAALLKKTNRGQIYTIDIKIFIKSQVQRG